ncbi:hypothetical protein GLOIN_2v1878750 [Rhizophagus clarus]|nr:hypothetical protein GLOIN_2v1878750 [Rhizophagus clarus]
MPIILKEVINLFINENMKFTHLYLPNQFDYKIHLISGFKYCFLELEFLQYDLYHNNQDVLEELAKLSKSIKNLEIRSHHNNDDTRMSGIIKLIEAQKELRYLSYKNCDKLLRKSIEESLIKHADTLHYLKIDNEPITKFLSYLVNLVSLELDGPGFSIHWKLLEDVSLPHLKLLKAKEICSKHLEKLIESTNGKLNEVSIHSFRYYDSNNDEIIQTIIKNCPNLKYLMLMLKNKDIIKFEELLTNCQYLNGLNLVMNRFDLKFDWNKFFEILTKSSPIGLFKFKFYFCRYRTLFSLESMNLFFDKWKGRRPMLLQTLPIYDYLGFKKYFDLIEKYKAEGVVKRYENVTYGNTYETFEWIKKRT